MLGKIVKFLLEAVDDGNTMSIAPKSKQGDRRSCVIISKDPDTIERLMAIVDEGDVENWKLTEQRPGDGTVEMTFEKQDD